VHEVEPLRLRFGSTPRSRSGSPSGTRWVSRATSRASSPRRAGSHATPATRSYTLSYLGRRADLGFDLWATVEDQVYGGTARENAQSDRALRETRGEILLCEGQPIRALY